MKRKPNPSPEETAATEIATDTLILENEPEEELIETPDGAFLSAVEPNKIEELELQPFSLMRQWVATTLGALTIVNSEDWFFNAIVIVWLCTLDEKKVLWAKQTKNKEAALSEAMAWGDTRGYSIRNFKALLEIYEKIMAEINASTQAVLATKNGDGPADPNSGAQVAS